MSSEETVIRVREAGKCFRIYDRQSDRLRQLVAGMIPAWRERRFYREFWAVRDVSLDVRRGETVGIVGRNGSGKSTLLQMVYGTLWPTTGTIRVEGRVAALLELGAGFNPEFTGRENVYMNASLLGLQGREIEQRMDSILEFADIGEFIDQPVKYYSSGMYARLAFATAISVDPDVLIVDEALAVGDETFQRKCFARMEEIREQGGTILFVSHSTASIVNLCDRAVLMHEGRLVYQGAPKKVVGWYQKLSNAPHHAKEILAEIRGEHGTPETEAEEYCSRKESPAPEPDRYDEGLVPESTIVYRSSGATILEPRIETPAGKRVNVLRGGADYLIRYRVRFDRACNARFRCMIKTVDGRELGGGTWPARCEGGSAVEAGEEVEVRFRFSCRLMSGTYFVNCGVSEHRHSLHRIIDALVFRVVADEEGHSFGSIDFSVRADLSRRVTG